MGNKSSSSAEPAMPRTGEPATSTIASDPPRFRLRWAILGANFSVLALNYADRAAIGVAAPLIVKEFGFSKATFGLILSVFFFGYAPFCFIGGYASDKFGPRKVMGIAIAWWSLFTVATVAGFNFISFMIIRFLFGFGEGPQGSVTAKTMSNWFPDRELGRSLGISQAATPLGGAIGTPLVVWMIASTSGNWRAPFIVLGIFGLLVSVGWYAIVRDRPDLHPWITRGELNEIERGEMVQRQETKAETAAGMRPYLRLPIVWSTAFAFFGYAWVLYTFLSWFPVYLVDVRGIDLKAVAVAGTVPWIAGVFGFIIGGMISDRIAIRTGRPAAARKMMIVGGLLVTGALFSGIAIVTTTLSSVILMSLVVFALYLTGAQYFALIGEIVPKVRLGGVAGFVHFIANLAGILAPVSVGFIVDRTGSWGLTFGVSGAICVAGALAMALFGRVKPYDNARAELNREPADAQVSDV